MFYYICSRVVFVEWISALSTPMRHHLHVYFSACKASFVLSPLSLLSTATPPLVLQVCERCLRSCLCQLKFKKLYHSYTFCSWCTVYVIYFFSFVNIFLLWIHLIGFESVGVSLSEWDLERWKKTNRESETSERERERHQRHLNWLIHFNFTLAPLCCCWCR